MLYGRLSSPFTAVYKYFLPPAWIAGFAWGTYVLFAHPESVKFNGVQGGVPPGLEWVLLATWLLGSTAMLWVAVRLRWLRAYDKVLYAGQFGREEAIPLDQVIGVSELWFRPLMIRIMYRGSDRSERIIWFLPDFDWPSGNVDAQILADLQALGASSRRPAA